MDGQGMKVYELVNCGDPYTIEGEFEHAAVAALMLGAGQYALVEGRETVMPVFMRTGDVEIEEWFLRRFERTPSDIFDEDREQIATVLDSILIGDGTDRQQYRAMDIPRQEWNDSRRTSPNEVDRYAADLAMNIQSSLRKTPVTVGSLTTT